jgi:thiamine biosynthesis lipoprotein
VCKQILIILMGCALLACQHNQAEKSEHQLYVFGTMVSITLWHDDPIVTQQAIDDISQMFNTMHHQWHAWKPGRLSDINQQLRAGKTVDLTAEEARFISQTLALTESSEGRFNPLIGELIHLWGFHTDDYPLLTPPPALTAIQDLLSQSLDTSQVTLKNNQLTAHNPHVWLDFGGIAKGYAVDRAIERLDAHGITSAIINTGGDLRSIGSKGEQPWRIAIQSPSNWQPVAELEVNQDEAIFTSGNYQRYKEFDGQRFSHIIHPLTGMPVAEVVSATVVTDSGIKADAAATALVVAGSKGWPEVAEKMGIDQVLVIDEHHHCSATRSMLERLKNLTVTCQPVD